MKEKLKEVFIEIDEHYKSVIIGDFDTDKFLCVIRAAFAKNYEFNLLCNNLTNSEDSFFLMPSLRGICEDLITIKYLKEHINVDWDKLITLLTTKSTFEGTIVQKAFFDHYKPEQIILQFKDAEKELASMTDQIKTIFQKNGLKGDKEFPSVSHMATDAKLIKLYDYLYYATSKTVHFEPGMLLRLGWAKDMTSTIFTFSTKNFNKYYFDFCSYYSAFLFVEFYKAFKKDLGLDTKIKGQIKKIQEILDDQLRMPEIVTFEECNVKPPSIITQLLTKASKRVSDKNNNR
ncbi:MAG: hypothetical protein HYR67_00450 [Bacteroidetes bacterium]|nr:hypothetical protein [Bacteroidota bacterium]